VRNGYREFIRGGVIVRVFTLVCAMTRGRKEKREKLSISGRKKVTSSFNLDIMDW